MKDTLEEIDLPDNWISLILDCMKSNSVSLIWKGKQTVFFSPSRGTRQGDPLSPYIFVLCIERLSHMINAVLRDKALKPIMIFRGAPYLSHLMFADDIILFAEASVEQMLVVQRCLEDFYLVSSQKVSLEKSRVLFSRNVSESVCNQVCEAGGIIRTTNIGSNLGFPTWNGRVSKHNFQHIVDRVKQRFAGWKAKTLSFAGQITLAKSVVNVMPFYYMQTLKFPDSVCAELDRLCCNLFGVIRVRNVRRICKLG